MSSPIAFAGFALLVLAAAGTGARYRPDEWYRTLAKPRWTPPGWLFAPAWSAIYVLYAFAGWLVWREVGFAQGAAALALYALHIALNAMWSPLFFGHHRIGLAWLDAGAMWVTLAGVIALFAPIRPLAAFLLAPYLAWASFAFVLNGAVWRLNRDADNSRGPAQMP